MPPGRSGFRVKHLLKLRCSNVEAYQRHTKTPRKRSRFQSLQSLRFEAQRGLAEATPRTKTYWHKDKATLETILFLWPAPCAFRRVTTLRLTRLPRHGPVPGGNRSAASCLCTVLRRALYHCATRSPTTLETILLKFQQRLKWLAMLPRRPDAFEVF